MGSPIISLHDWFQTPPGRYLLDWESQQVDLAVADVFGFHALQLGAPALPGLRANRMPHQWLALEQYPAEAAGQAQLFCDFSALPFPDSSVDLVLLPHTLECSADPHRALREVARVLVPEGRVVLTGLNPFSWWGLRQRRGGLYTPQGQGELLSPGRLRDWLRLLDLEVESVQLGCYCPPWPRADWLQRWAWIDRLAPRCCPVLGAVYCVQAVKRVRGVHLLAPARKPAAALVRQPLPVANRAPQRSGLKE